MSLEKLATNEVCPIPGDEDAWEALQALLRSVDAIPEEDRPRKFLSVVTTLIGIMIGSADQESLPTLVKIIVETACEAANGNGFEATTEFTVDDQTPSAALH